MAGKISVKTAIIISFLCGIVLILCSCVNPVNIQLFLEDDHVVVIIEATKAVVRVIHQTGDNLKGLNGRIEGLSPDKYYMVEKEEDADGNFAAGYPKYVTDKHPTAPLVPGALWGELEYITRISGGRINALTNFHTYTVRDAKPFPPNTEFKYKDGDSAPKTVNVIDGAITISNPKIPVYLVELGDEFDGYEVMAVAVNPDETPSSSPFCDFEKVTIGTTGDDVTSFQLEGLNTTFDYIFANKNLSTPAFKVLKVIIDQSKVQFITIELNIGELMSAPTSNSGLNLVRGDYDGSSRVNLTLSSPTGGSWSDIKWSINPDIDAYLGNTAQLVITNGGDFLASGLLAANSFVVSVTAISGGAPYSAKVVINVRN
jgi:hypothetical protein